MIHANQEHNYTSKASRFLKLKHQTRKCSELIRSCGSKNRCFYNNDNNNNIIKKKIKRGS